MQYLKVSLRSLASSRSAGAALVGLWILIASTGVVAQSGRKLPDWGDKKSSPPPAAPDPTPTPSSRPEKVPIVVTSHLDDIVYGSSILTGDVSDALIQRLNEANLFSVTREQEMNRKEASDRAKGMSDGYVVWFQLESESTQSVGMGPQYDSQLYVNFVIYKPATGKVLTQGHVYQRPVGAVGGGPLPAPTGGSTSGTQIEYRLRRAGRETAERVLQALGKPPIPGH
jgi:hypothetical protein